ncbi:hypothetical protein SDC9_112405 [bioreactor metagenome]|uniref:Uncharacterized protein n=1 Tax=bioreactor metagenome TaxID=1076179 RepID=A0A645BK87_9ZZZZ
MLFLGQPPHRGRARLQGRRKFSRPGKAKDAVITHINRRGSLRAFQRCSQKRGGRLRLDLPVPLHNKGRKPGVLRQDGRVQRDAVFSQHRNRVYPGAALIAGALLLTGNRQHQQKQVGDGQDDQNDIFKLRTFHAGFAPLPLWHITIVRPNRPRPARSRHPDSAAAARRPRGAPHAWRPPPAPREAPLRRCR